MAGTVADYVVKALAKQGVKRVYGNLGAAVVPLLQCIEKAKIEYVVCRTEANAALAASAEAKLTGSLAVCIATSGPGASNLVTGLLDAQADRAPVLALTGDLPTYKMGRGLEFQEMDQGAVLGPVVGQSVTAAHPQSVPALLQRSVGRALNNREAVHLNIPVDIQRALATAIAAPVLCSLDSKGIVSELHSNYVGVLGIFGSPAFAVSQDTIEGAKLVVAIGMDNPSVFVTSLEGEQVRELIVVDHDFSSMAHSFATKAAVVGPLSQALDGISKSVAQALKDKSPCPKAQAAIADLLTKKKSFIAKAMWTGLFLHFCNRETMLTTAKHGVMGWSLPACVAAKMAQPSSTVVGIAGDGGCLMSVQELATAVQYNTSFVYFVFRNAVLRRVVGSPFMDIGQTDFATVAKGFGAKGLCLDSNDVSKVSSTLREAFDHIDANRGPVVIHVSVDPLIGAPMSSWNDKGERLMSYK
eukprot:m51a1_g3645 putative pyruvate dehydrogenase (470) ;mRNA; r:191049-193410